MNSQAKALYQPWNEEAFLADTDVRCMNAVERWMYRSLLQSAFIESTRPNLPDDDSVLWVLAGCENIEQWHKHKTKVLQKFTKIEIDGCKLLWQKRLNEDWQRLENKRETLTERAKAGGLARAKQMLSNELATGLLPASHKLALGKPQASQVREVSKKEREESKVSLEKAQTPEARISILAKEHFGQVEEKSFFKKDLRALSENHTQDEILAAFELWMNNTPYTGKYPVSAFCRVAESLISGGSIATEINPDLQYVLDKSGSLSNNKLLFSPRHYALLAKMILDYGRESVVQVFSEFYQQVDENNIQSLNYAPKDFIEKGPQMLRTRKILQDEAKKQADMINRMADEGQKKAEQEIAETERKMREEQELAENDLQEFFGVTNDSK